MSTLDFIPRTIKKRQVDPASVGKPAIAETSKGPSMSQDYHVSLSPGANNILETAEVHGDFRLSGNERRRWPVFKCEASIRNPEGSATPEHAILVWLALSDYVLWKDGELRQQLDLGTKPPVQSGEGEDEDTLRIEKADNFGCMSHSKFLLQRTLSNI